MYKKGNYYIPNGASSVIASNNNVYVSGPDGIAILNDTGLSIGEAGYYSTAANNLSVSGEYIFFPLNGAIQVLRFTPAPVSLREGEANVIGGINGWVEPDAGESARIMLNPSVAGKVTVSIYNLSGQLVWVEAMEIVGDIRNQTEVVWPCMNAAGQKVASGIYVVNARGAGIDMKKKIAVIR
jgi:hypothetical protein